MKDVNVAIKLLDNLLTWILMSFTSSLSLFLWYIPKKQAMEDDDDDDRKKKSKIFVPISSSFLSLSLVTITVFSKTLSPIPDDEDCLHSVWSSFIFSSKIFLTYLLFQHTPEK